MDTEDLKPGNRKYVSVVKTLTGNLTPGRSDRKTTGNRKPPVNVNVTGRVQELEERSDRKTEPQETFTKGYEIQKRNSKKETGKMLVASPGNRMPREDRKWLKERPLTPGISPAGKVGKHSIGKKKRLFGTPQHNKVRTNLILTNPFIIQDLERNICATQSGNRKGTHTATEEIQDCRLVSARKCPILEPIRNEERSAILPGNSSSDS
jgi:hypothetical protein